jgi:hypothetical protein
MNLKKALSLSAWTLCATGLSLACVSESDGGMGTTTATTTAMSKWATATAT